MEVSYIIFADESKLNLYWKALNRAVGYPNARTLQHFDQVQSKAPNSERFGVLVDGVISANLPQTLSYPTDQVTADHYYTVTFDDVEEWYDQPIDPAVHLRAWIGDYMICPAASYQTSLQTIADGKLTPEQDVVLGGHFGYMVDGSPYVGSVEDYNTYAGATLSGFVKPTGIVSQWVDSEGNIFYVILIKGLTDHLSEREIMYLLAVGETVPSFTICRNAADVLNLVQPV